MPIFRLPRQQYRICFAAGAWFRRDSMNATHNRHPAQTQYLAHTIVVWWTVIGNCEPSVRISRSKSKYLIKVRTRTRKQLLILFIFVRKFRLLFALFCIVSAFRIVLPGCWLLLRANVCLMDVACAYNNNKKKSPKWSGSQCVCVCVQNGSIFARRDGTTKFELDVEAILYIVA